MSSYRARSSCCKRPIVCCGGFLSETGLGGVLGKRFLSEYVSLNFQGGSLGYLFGALCNAVVGSLAYAVVEDVASAILIWLEESPDVWSGVEQFQVEARCC